MEKEKADREIFISYCHADKEHVDKIDNAFNSLGMTLTRDIRDAKAYTSIKDFMGRIRNSDYVILVVSDSYMRSRNCMYEILELLKNDDYKNHIFPIVIRSADFNIYSDDSLTSYLGYWDNEYKELERKSAGFRPEETIEIKAKQRMITNIKMSVDSFIETLQELKSPSLEELEATSYKPIIDKIKPAGQVIDRGLFDKCLMFFSGEDRETAIEMFFRDNSLIFGDWLLEKIRPAHYSDTGAPRKMVLLAEIVKRMGKGTWKSLETIEHIKGIYGIVVLDELRKPPVNRHDPPGRDEEEQEKRKILLANSLLEAFTIIGFIKGKAFDFELANRCFKYYIGEQDRELAVQKFKTYDRRELGDWLLGKIKPDWCSRNEWNSYAYVALAEIIREIGEMTHAAAEVRNNVVYELKNDSFDYDPEYNDMVTLRLYSLRKSLEIIDGSALMPNHDGR